MTHLAVVRPSFYSPIGVCAECKHCNLNPDFPLQRVHCWEGAYDFQLCLTCLGIGPCEQVDPSRFADLAEMHQRHDVAKGIRSFRTYIVNPDGSPGQNHAKEVNIKKKDTRKGDRHRTGYFTEYMREYRARIKTQKKERK